MNSEQDDLELVRKLLALKKYEQPPPGYFNQLPRQIWLRIEREPASFWQRIFPNISLNPALAYSFGLLACGTLFFGVVYSLQVETTQPVAEPIAKNWRNNEPRLARENGIGIQLAPYQPVQTQTVQVASTNPVLNTDQLPSLFTGVNLQVQPVNYSVGQ
jgi:hypothetical protein